MVPQLLTLHVPPHSQPSSPAVGPFQWIKTFTFADHDTGPHPPLAPGTPLSLDRSKARIKVDCLIIQLRRDSYPVSHQDERAAAVSSSLDFLVRSFNPTNLHMAGRSPRSPLYTSMFLPLQDPACVGWHRLKSAHFIGVSPAPPPWLPISHQGAANQAWPPCPVTFVVGRKRICRRPMAIVIWLREVKNLLKHCPFNTASGPARKSAPIAVISESVDEQAKAVTELRQWASIHQGIHRAERVQAVWFGVNAAALVQGLLAVYLSIT